MSVVGPRGRIVMMVAVGTLGAGCGGAEPFEAMPSQTAPLASSSGWTVSGVMVPGTVYSDELMDVVVEPSTGDVLVAGYENGRLGMANVDPSGNARGVIIRYDSNLSMLDKIRIDSTSSAEVVQALALKPGSPDIYFAGRTTGSFNGTPNAGQYDLLLGWVDAANTRRIFQYGHQRPEHPVRLVVDKDGKLVVSGYTDTYIPSNYVEAWEDPFVMKWTRENNALKATPDWEVQYNTAMSDVLPGLAVDSAANVYVSGANPSGTSRGMYVKQYQGATGTAGWYMQQSTVSLDMAAALSASPLNANHLLMAGSTYAQLGERLFGQQDVVVRMLDKSGTTPTTVWTHQYGSDESEWVTDMTQDAQGNIYVVGETLGSFDSTVAPQGDYDIFVLKLDSNGLNPQVFQIGSYMDDHPAAVAVDASGAIYVVGYSSGSLFTGQANLGERDSFVMKLVPPSSDGGGIGI